MNTTKEILASITDSIKTVLRQYIPILKQSGLSEEEINWGLETIFNGYRQLALEARQTEIDKISFADAVTDIERFPYLCRVHHGWTDLLSMEVPAELIPLAKKSHEVLDAPLVETIRKQVAEIACVLKNGSPERAFARFCLFEAVRINLDVQDGSCRAEILRSGLTDDDLNEIAESRVHDLINNADVLHTGESVRPLALLVVSAMSDLTELVASIHAATNTVREDITKTLELRVQLEALISDMDPVDAILIRNHFAETWGESRRDLGRLIRIHPLILGERQPKSLARRLERKLEKLKDLENLRKRKPTIRLRDLVQVAGEISI